MLTLLALFLSLDVTVIYTQPTSTNSLSNVSDIFLPNVDVDKLERPEVRFVLETYYLNKNGEFNMKKWYTPLKYRYDAVIASRGITKYQRNYINSQKIRFKVTDDIIYPLKERIVHAFIYLYQYESLFKEKEKPFTILVFRRKRADDESNFMPVGAKDVPTDRIGWVNISVAVTPLFPQRQILTYFVRISHPDHIGPLGMREAGFADEDDVIRQPFLAIHFERETLHDTSDIDISPGIGYHEQCNVHPLHVEFASLGVTNVLAPLSYEAGYCNGSCTTDWRGFYQPFGNYFIYSLVLSYMQDNDPEHKPLLCCVPIKMSEMELVSTLSDTMAEVRVIYGSVTACACL